MHFEGEFEVGAAADDVLAAFEDVERMARCMPGASIVGHNPDGTYQGSMLVAFGPKKIRFDGRVKCDIDPMARQGRLSVAGGAQLRTPAPAQVEVQYTVEPLANGAQPRSRVSLVSNAQLGGVLEEFARTGGVAVTQALMQLFAQRLSEELAASKPAVAAEPLPQAVVTESPLPTPRGSSPPSAPALSATRLMWLVLSGRVRAWWLQLRRGAG